MESLAIVQVSNVLASIAAPSVKDCPPSKFAPWLINCKNRGWQSIPYDLFKNPHGLLHISENPYVCDCGMVWFFRESRVLKDNVKDLDFVRCAKPAHLSGRRLVDLTEKDICTTGRVSKKDCLDEGEFYDCSSIDRIPYDTFKIPLKAVIITGAYKCDCDMVSFLRRLQDPDFYKTVKLEQDIFYCSEPLHLQYISVLDLKPESVCPLKLPDVCQVKPKPCNETVSTCTMFKGLVTCADIDECAVGNSRCQKNEECVNKKDGYTCRCKPGFVRADNGPGCIEFIDPCAKTPSPCNETTHTCVPGKKSNSYRCEEIDECALNKDNCHKDAECKNTVSGYECRCKPGFKEYNSGRHCEDVNECLGKVDCAKEGKCNNALGTFTCVCNSGFYGDGKSCEDIDECSGTSYCAANARCVNTVGSYQCICNHGFRGDGKVCSDVDECTRNKGACPANAKCQNTVGSYMCGCKPGYSWNGEYCLDVDECSSSKTNNCDDNALCINKAGGYKCRCREGFDHFKEGRLCLKEEGQTSDSSPNVVIIVAPICLAVILVLLLTFSLMKRKTNKQKESSSGRDGLDKDREELPRLLLGQTPETMFAPEILPTLSAFSEWSEEEKDFDEDEYELN